MEYFETLLEKMAFEQRRERLPAFEQQHGGPIPAPTVAFERASIKMKLPVVRLLAYGSKKSGTLASNSTEPISFIRSCVACSCMSVLMLTRWRMRVARIFVWRTVCLTR